jgi:aspartate aminotransferase
MTGWRVGYLAASTEIIKAATLIQGHSTSNICTFAQYGAVAALNDSQDCVEEMRLSFAAKREVMYEGLSQIPKITCLKPDGAFYLLPNISQLGLTSMEFAERLLEQQQVAIIPGIAFGVDVNVRLSYATDIETIKKGCDRISKFVQSIL